MSLLGALSLAAYVAPACTPICSAGGSVPDVSAAVDLGLPSGTLWAPWNVGATKAGEAGAYFAWGETTAKESYYWGTYKHMKDGESDWYHINKYTTDDNQTYAVWYADVKFVGDGKTTLETIDDAAARNWGGKWRMPTKKQLSELFRKCTAEWKNAGWDGDDSLAGYLLTGPNGNNLFLPAAGGRWDFYDFGSHGRYWSADLYSGYSYDACNLSFDSLVWYEDDFGYRCSGFSVRPVCPSAL